METNVGLRWKVRRLLPITHLPLRGRYVGTSTDWGMSVSSTPSWLIFSFQSSPYTQIRKTGYFPPSRSTCSLFKKDLLFRSFSTPEMVRSVKILNSSGPARRELMTTNTSPHDAFKLSETANFLRKSLLAKSGQDATLRPWVGNLDWNLRVAALQRTEKDLD